MKSSSLAILQPEIPHYRTEFFHLLEEKCGKVDIFTFVGKKDSENCGLMVQMNSIHIACRLFGPILIYNPLPLLSRRYDTLVLMLHFGHLTTWLLLLTRFIHRKKIVVWGQGISVKRYLKEEINPDWRLQWMIKLADGAWLYMDKEYQLWRSIFPNKPMAALGNSLSGIDEMIKYQPTESKDNLKKKYGIIEQHVFVFCARFENPYRRTDLLLEIIEKLDSTYNGFIIIGTGKNKPDFSHYPNVYDFGALYDTTIKRELFYLSDLYLQPGWVGLSIVEAMAYGKPICTFVRSVDTLQCVEYSYIQDGVNGMIFENMNDCLERLSNCSYDKILFMGENAKKTILQFSPQQMAKNAILIL